MRLRAASQRDVSDGFSTAISLEGPASVGLEDKFRPRISRVWQPWSRSCCCNPMRMSRFSGERLPATRGHPADGARLDLPGDDPRRADHPEDDGLAMSSRNTYLTAASARWRRSSTRPCRSGGGRARRHALRRDRARSTAALTDAVSRWITSRSGMLNPCASLRKMPLRDLAPPRGGEDRRDAPHRQHRGGVRP